MNKSDASERSKQQQFQDAQNKSNKKLFASLADLFIKKIEDSRELHKKIAEEAQKEQDKKEERLRAKDERKSMLGQMAKNVLTQTVIGKAYKKSSKFLTDKKNAVEDYGEKIKNKAIAGATNTAGAILGSDVKIDINDLYKKESDTGTSSASSASNSSSSKNKSNSEDEKQSKQNKNDSKNIEKILKSNDDLSGEVKDIKDNIYDFTHKQDTSITKKDKKASIENIKCGLGKLPKTEENSNSSNFPDIFKRTKSTRVPKKVTKPSKFNKLKSNISKTAKNSKVGKGLSKAAGVAKNSKSAVGTGLEKTGLKAISKKIPGLATVATVGIGAYDYATANDDKGRKDAVSGTGGALAGMWAGGEAGAALGATIGAFFGGVGAAPGALIGGIIGSVAGGIAGSSLGQWVGDALFSDIDDTIPDKFKKNPFSFYNALENMKVNFEQVLQNTKDKDKRKDIIKKINEVNDRQKEVISDDELQDWLEDTIDKAKKIPALKNKSDEEIAKIIITSDAVPPKAKANLVEIYNKEIVGGIFSSDGNLKLDKKDLEGSKQNKSAAKFDDNKKGKRVSKQNFEATIGNEELYKAALNNKKDKLSEVTTKNTGGWKKKNHDSSFDLPKNSKRWNKYEKYNDVNKLKKLKNRYSKLAKYSPNKSNKHKFSQEVKDIDVRLKEIDGNSTANIKSKDNSGNVDVSNTTKQLINNSSKPSGSEKVVEKTLQPIVHQAPASKESNSGVGINNFSNQNQDVIASEMIGGV